jgi:hypothetical protein
MGLTSTLAVGGITNTSVFASAILASEYWYCTVVHEASKAVSAIEHSRVLIFIIIAFLNYCLQIEQKDRLSSEELLFSEFITLDTEKFTYLNSDNLFEKFPIIENIYDDYRIKLDIRDQRELNKKLGI